MFLRSDALAAMDTRVLDAWDWSRTTILWVSHGWDPVRQGAQSITGRRLVQALLRSGARVHVVAARQADEELRHPNYAVSVVEGLAPSPSRAGRTIQMIRCGVPESTAPWVSAAVEGSLRVLSELPADTLIYSRASPGVSNIVGWHLARLTGLSWVAHFSDKWPPHNPLARGKKWLVPYKWPLFQLWWRRIVRDSGALTFSNPRQAQECLGEKFAACRHKTFVAAHLPSTLEPRNTAPQYETFHIVHTGNLYRGQTSAALMKGLRLFLDRTPAARGRIRMTQAGWSDGDMPAWARTCGLTDIVRFMGRVTPQDVLRLVDDASLLLAFDYARPDSSTMLSKLPDYVYAGRPILALTSETASLGRFFGEDGAGLWAPYDDEEKVAEHIARVFAAWCERRQAFLPGPAAVESFHWRRVLSELAGAFTVARDAAERRSPQPDLAYGWSRGNARLDSLRNL